VPSIPAPLHLETLLINAGYLVLAWALGGLIGWQREVQGRAAGLRTHMLVCLGSCLVARVSFGGLGDPGRIAAQIVTGIGFLGAGVILHRGASVRGLTTAATIWVVAGIGIATGAGGAFALLATFSTLLSLLTLTFARRIEDQIGRSRREVTLSVVVARRVGAVSRLLETLTGAGADVIGFETEEDDSDEARALRVHLRLRQDVTRAILSAAVAEQLPGATFAWE
jgi:putative Mg2+ transporter-C (MgtC) family protein